MHVTYDWVYLCSDPRRRLAITLQLLPREPLVGLRRMHVCWCSHLDPAIRPLELEISAEAFAPSWLQYQVTDLSSLAAGCPVGLQRYFFHDKPRWALGVKLLLPVKFEAPAVDHVGLLAERFPFGGWSDSQEKARGCQSKTVGGVRRTIL